MVLKTVPSLYELFLLVPDPRHARGVRHSLAALLTLTATAMLAGARTLTDNNLTSAEAVLAITSLTRLRASAERLLALSRQHWSIENRLHLVRDVSLGEDACRVRSGQAPQNLAALRNLCLGLLRRTRFRYVPDAIRLFVANPFAALGLIRPSAAIAEVDN